MALAEGKIIVMLGAPGAGKGTQARQLQEKFNWPQISTGDILRGMAKADTPLGREIKEIQAAGKLVGDDILAEVVRKRTAEKDCQRGYILDGYPRTLKQADQLESMAKEQGRDIIVINVNVDHDILLKRLTGRRTCQRSGCGEIYNIHFKPPQTAGVCDKCSGELINRSDDRVEAIEKRLEEYHRSTAPLIDYYQRHGQIVMVDGTLEPENVFAALCHAVGS
jgi:adenylate kinase